MGFLCLVLKNCFNRKGQKEREFFLVDILTCKSAGKTIKWEKYPILYYLRLQRD